MKPPRRRRQFATPFVLTAALAPACTVQNSPPPAEPEPATTTVDHRGEGETTPPAPGSETVPVEGATQPGGGVIIANPPRPQPQPQADVPAGWTVSRNDDGTCTAYPPPANCPPKATCNPPPPRKVACPPETGPTQK
jgi:hypothetical protein